MGKTILTDEIASAICEGLADGRSLRAICQEPGMPSGETVRRWLRDNEEFRAQYARAREDQGHSDADQIKDITDKVIHGLIDPQAARVVIDALKWTAARRVPKVYGDRQTIDLNRPLEEASTDELLAKLKAKGEQLGIAIPDAKALGLE